MSPVAISFEIFSCHKCTYSQVWLKDSRRLIIVLGIVQEKSGIKEAAQIKTVARESSAISELMCFTVGLKGNLPRY